MLCQVSFGNTMVVLYYSSLLMYFNLFVDKVFERQKEVVLPVSVREYQTHKVHVRNDVTDSNRKIHHS